MSAPEPSPFRPGNPARPTLRYLFLRFFRHGLFAYGGPAAQLGHLRAELVQRDGWTSPERFAKVQALYQALPGPETIELAVYFGTRKRGRLGGVVSGSAFLLPGVLLVLLVAAAYVALAARESWWFAPALVGLRAVGVATLLRAALRLGWAYLRTADLLAIAAAGAALAFFLPRLLMALVIVLGGVAGLALATARGRVPLRPWPRFPALPLPLAALALPAALGTGAAVFLVSLQAGFLSFGGAFTALPFLYEGAVEQHRWLTPEQFAEAVALVGLVPAPLAAEAVFIGYLAAGLGGAVLAGVAIFLPAFAFTLVGHRPLEQLVDDPHVHAAMLGVTAAAIGLLVSVLATLGPAGIVDPWTLLIAAGVFAALYFRVPNPIAITGGAAAAVALRLAGLS